jgi:hypothetical protein
MIAARPIANTSTPSMLLRSVVMKRSFGNWFDRLTSDPRVSLLVAAGLLKQLLPLITPVIHRFLVSGTAVCPESATARRLSILNDLILYWYR